MHKFIIKPDFEITTDQLKPDTNYFFRAHAINAEGLSVGSIKSFSTKELHTGPGWIDAQPVTVAENWWSSQWLGNFYIAENNGWMMHEDLGWMFVLGQPDRSIWLWKEEMVSYGPARKHIHFCTATSRVDGIFRYFQRRLAGRFMDWKFITI